MRTSSNLRVNTVEESNPSEKTMSKKTDKLMNELEVAANNYRLAQRRLGEVLHALSEEGEPIDIIMEKVLRDKYGIPVATSICMLRWVRGEFGNEKRSILATSKINHSELAEMPKTALDAVFAGPHRIKADEGRVVEKTIEEMTRTEAKANIDRRGVIPIATDLKRQPEFRSAKANSVTTDQQGNIVFVSDGREPIHMRVTNKLLEKAMSMSAVGAAA